MRGEKRRGGDALTNTTVSVVLSGVELSTSPGGLYPMHAALESTRKAILTCFHYLCTLFW